MSFDLGVTFGSQEQKKERRRRSKAIDTRKEKSSGFYGRWRGQAYIPFIRQRIVQERMNQTASCATASSLYLSE